ncbi:uncharacterized protein LOC126791937 [Argentina anserina]|uniref:uncharacterized protein LOC126791937 n=1 Tax=Argentina anserina TaxID=57926 RepID=UPI0021765B76|nr:uncharacterized protein LOC126791937 [Potentilla anserina]
MGVKRPFDDVDFKELPYKHSRQLDCSDKSSPLSNVVSFYSAPEKPYVSGEDGDGLCKSQWLGPILEKYNVDKDSTALSEGCVKNATSAFVASFRGEEEAGSCGQGAYPPHAEYFEYEYPRRAFVPLNDDYSSLLDRSPRKQVPIGPNYQASIPSWSGHSKKLNQEDGGYINHHSLQLTTEYDVDEMLLGTTVIPMSDVHVSALECNKVGQGRKNCKCIDSGTYRCVQQHIIEARKELKRTLGNEKFVKLGFRDMGEEVVALRWSDKEEQAFHDVVYSNPASLGRKFWKHLSAVFPSRSERELVSYYFNVFMLRRRAVQNRSIILEIDSDDDEWHGSYWGANGGTVAEDDEDSVVDSVEDGQPVGPRGYSEEDDSDDDDSDGDDYVGYGEDGGMDHIRGESYRWKLVNEAKRDTISQNGEKIPGCYGEEFGYLDDSCVSFEFQPYMHDSCGRMDAEPAAGGLQGTGFKDDPTRNLHSQDDASSDVVGHGYLLEPCDAKVWDARIPTDPMKAIDLLPTWSMIEDIFD